MIYCVACGSDDTRKVSLLFEQGANQMNPMVGVGIGGGGLGVGVAAGIGWQSALASRLAPPAPPWYNARGYGWVAFFVAGVIGVFTAGSVDKDNIGWALGFLFIGAPVIGFLTYRFSTISATPAYRVAIALWRRQWCCMRCGQVFAP